MLLEPLFAHAQRQPDQVAVIDDRGRFTYRQLAARAAQLSSILRERTRQPRIGILLPSSAEFVAAFYGALLTGQAVVPINFLLSDREVVHVIRDSGIDTIVTIPQLAGRLREPTLNVVDLTQHPPTQAQKIGAQFTS